MSLDICLIKTMPTEVHSQNITHNLGKMAGEAGIYQALWHPEEAGITTAKQLIAPLSEAIVMMSVDPARFKKHNPENGWGSYEGFVPWLVQLRDACTENPDATVEVSI